MKKKFLFHQIFVIAFVLQWLASCTDNPTVATDPVTNISTASATGGGKVLDDGKTEVTARGVCWSTNPSPTRANSTTIDGSGTGSFTSSITELTPGTFYYVRAYAVNSEGFGYGNEVSFTTDALSLAAVSTSPVISITSNTAESGGNVTTDGGSGITARGVCWNTLTNPTTSNFKTTDGSGIGAFASSITELLPAKTYYLRAYATNSVGTAYGEELNFPTPPAKPTVTTNSITEKTQTSAKSGGNISDDGGANVTARGVCWSTSQNPTTSDSHTIDGNGSGSFSSSLTELTPNTVYYVRAYATNIAGTAFGNERSFTTEQEIITDIDGNIYTSVTIVSQVWMVGNLKTTRLNDGTDITYSNWKYSYISPTYPAYCWYNDDASTYKADYGALYNWYAVNTGKLCPVGWRVPTGDEWKILVDNWPGGGAGGALKEMGTTHWQSPNGEATNQVGFTALPGGYRAVGIDVGPCRELGYTGYWWSFGDVNSGRAVISIGYKSGAIGSSNAGVWLGYSVRCLKDN